VFYKANPNKVPQWSSKNPNGRIDFILLNQGKWNGMVKGCYVYYTEVSDHLPLIMDFKSQLGGGGGKIQGTTHVQTAHSAITGVGSTDQLYASSVAQALKAKLNSQIPPKAPHLFRIVSWNVHYGYNYKENLSQFGIDGVKNDIRKLNPDVAIIQNALIGGTNGKTIQQMQNEFNMRGNKNCESFRAAPIAGIGTAPFNKLNTSKIDNVIFVKDSRKIANSNAGNLGVNNTALILGTGGNQVTINNYTPCYSAMVVTTPGNNQNIGVVSAYLDDGKVNVPATIPAGQAGGHLKTEANAIRNLANQTTLFGLSFNTVGGEPNAELKKAGGNQLQTIFDKVGVPNPTWTSTKNAAGVLDDMVYVLPGFTPQIAGAYVYYSNNSNHLAYVVDILDGAPPTPASIHKQAITSAAPQVTVTGEQVAPQTTTPTTGQTPQVNAQGQPLTHNDILDQLQGKPQITPVTPQGATGAAGTFLTPGSKTHQAVQKIQGQLEQGIKGLSGLMHSKIIMDGPSPCPQADFLPCFPLDTSLVKGLLDHLIPEANKAKTQRAKDIKDEENPETEDEDSEDHEENEQAGGRKKRGRTRVRYVLTRPKRGGADANEMGSNLGLADEDKQQTKVALLSFEQSLKTIGDQARIRRLLTIPINIFPQAQRVALSLKISSLASEAIRVLGNYNLRLQMSLIEAGKTNVYTLSQYARNLQKLAADLQEPGPPPPGPPGNSRVFLRNYENLVNAATNTAKNLSGQVRRFLATETERKMYAAGVLAFMARLFAMGMEDNVDAIRQHLRTTQHMEVDDAMVKLLSYLRETSNLQDAPHAPQLQQPTRSRRQGRGRGQGSGPQGSELRRGDLYQNDTGVDSALGSAMPFRVGQRSAITQTTEPIEEPDKNAVNANQSNTKGSTRKGRPKKSGKKKHQGPKPKHQGPKSKGKRGRRKRK
jgi:hypothetical protein